MNEILSAVLRAIRQRKTASILILLGGFAPNLFADLKLDLIKTASGSYSNVTIFNRTSTHLSFAHANGVAVIKLSDIDADSLAAINGSNSVAAGSGSVILSGNRRTDSGDGYTPAGDRARINSFVSALAANPALQNSLRGVSRTFIYAVLGGLLLAWLFLCFCFAKICKKAGAEPGFLIWLPVLQLFPLLKAAQMPFWWFLLWFVPVINLVAQVLWCIRIADARGKSPWVGVLLILPVTNLFALLYLAFSATDSALAAATPPPPMGAPRPAAA